MEDLGVLRDLLLIFAIGVGVAFALRKIGVPSIAGFIVAGILIGPRSLGLIDDLHEVEILAEIGVVLLLFGIGLELSLEKVKRLWKPILLGGSLQVAVTVGIATAAALAMALPLNQAVFLGFMIAISSTAIVLRGLEYREEIDAPHGRFALGILVFQDLCVVPMILAIPLLAGSGGSGLASVLALGKAVLVVSGVLVASRLVVPRLLHYIARTGQRDLFVLVVLLICIGTAWIVSLAGVSLALGAFLAGLVVASSDYRHQALADLIPLREVLASLFFISVGMLLDPLAVARNPLPVLGLLIAILVVKFLVITGVALALRLPLRVALISGMILAQTGEFLFVLVRSAEGTSLVNQGLQGHLMAAAILSMLVTPLLMYASPHVAAGISSFGVLHRYLGIRSVADDGTASVRNDHVIIAGHGVAGLELASALREHQIDYVIVELNAETVRELLSKEEPALFGDVTNAEVLEKLGVHHAKELVIAINDPDAAVRAVKEARRLAPELPILVRVRYVAEVDELLASGATRVVPSEFESAVEVVSRVLEGHGIGREEIERHVERMHGRCKVKRADD